MVHKKIVTSDKILIVNLGGLGDALLSIPSLRALRAAFPKAKITMLTSPSVGELVKDLPYIDAHYDFNVKYRRRVPINQLLRDFKILLELRRERFDLAINMRTLFSDNGALKMRFLLAVINAASTAGRNTDGRGNFFDISVPETTIATMHEMEYDIITVEALGAKVDTREIDLHISHESAQKVDRLIKKIGATDKDILIGIHPGGMPTRRWPLERFVAAIDAIAREASSRVFVFCTGNEDHLCDILVAMSKKHKIEHITGLSIQDLLAFINRYHLFITNDTGPMNMAASLKRPMVALRGSTEPTRFDPCMISDKAVVVRSDDVECAPCEKYNCNDLRCMKQITVEAVVKASLGLLRKERSDAVR